MARLTPVFKKEDPAEIGNYRPLSLLRVPSKILDWFESCVMDIHVIVKHVFSDNEVFKKLNAKKFLKDI